MNAPQRRKTDNPWQALWDSAYPWPQIITVLLAAAVMIGIYSGRIDAQAKELEDQKKRLTVVEAAVIRIDQRLKDIMLHFNIPIRENY